MSSRFGEAGQAFSEVANALLPSLMYLADILPKESIVWKMKMLRTAPSFQEELRTHDGVSKGKYTIGLGQDSMAFCTEVEDVISMRSGRRKYCADKYQAQIPGALKGSGRRRLWSSATWRSKLKAATAPLGGILDGGEWMAAKAPGIEAMVANASAMQSIDDGGERLRDGDD